MGYFDALASSSFKEAKSGKLAFYPWGRFGKGYELETEEQHQTLRRSIIRYYMFVLPVSVFAAVGFGVYGLLAIPVVVLPYLFMVPRMTKGLSRTDERLTFKDSYEAQAKRHSPVMLWALFLVSLAFTAGGVFLVGKPESFLIALLCIVLFGACTIVFAWMLLARRRLMREADTEKVRVFD